MADRPINGSELRGVLKLALRAKEAAEALGISPWTLWSLTNRNEVSHIGIGRLIRYPIDLLKQYLATNVAKGGAQ